jgi:hypothetical protein
MFCDVCAIHPIQGFHKDIVECGSEVAHECHEKEWNLQNRVLDKFQAVDYLIVPVCRFQIYKESEEPEEALDANDG